MRRFMRAAAVLVSFAVIISTGICAYADYSDYYDFDYSYFDYLPTSNTGYSISGYDVDIVVNEDNTLSVCETITADFHQPKHGIYRYIPVRSTLQRADGTSADYCTKVKGVSCNMHIYDKYRDGNNYVIQIGDEDVQLTGKQEYVLRYTYSIGKDLLDGGDELYYDIIGTGWDTTISDVTFSISMPKDFDADKLGFSTGGYGSQGTDIVDYRVDGTTITGRLTDSLDAHHGLTVRIGLDDGYFRLNRLAYYGRYVAQIALSVLALIIVVVLWFRYGRDKRIVDVVEFYPPEGMNCAEISYWNNGMVSSNDVVPMLIELANEGYLSIEEYTTGKGLLKKDSFRLVKLRTYNGHDKLKHKFFNGLFDTGDVVEEKDLQDRFYVVINDIVNKIQTTNRTAVFNKDSLLKRLLGWLVSGAAVFLNILIFAVTNYNATMDYIILAVALGIAVAAFIFAFFIRQRTDKGHDIKQRINCFRMFLETAEKDRLEQLVMEDPAYFYNILPYAYVLGVSDKWTKKFESIALEPPQWYRSARPDIWDYMVFNHFMRSTINTATKAMISTPQSSGSGGGGSFGGGGGGFSGGGFGGGGGGSW